MERLTKRCKQALNDEMTKFKKFIEIALSEPKYHEKGNFSTQSTKDIYETNRLYPMASKLADYEDAEEQGLLLRLPCKVGSTVYLINSRYTKCTQENQEFDEYSCQGCELLDCDSHKEYYIHTNQSVSLEWVIRYSKDFGKTVFLTREEAEKALADMGV